jgi:hypothetical protein
MKYLDDIVEEINSKLELRSASLNGIVKQGNHGKEKRFLDKNGENILLSNEYEVYLYHRAERVSLDLLQTPGKGKRYNANASIELIVYSKHRDIDEYILSVMSLFQFITINDIDYDSYKIWKDETGKDEYDFERYVFKISYTARRVVNMCFECAEC